MFKLMGSIVRRAYSFLGRYFHARRHETSLPLSVSLLDQKKSAARISGAQAMSGYLRDISKTGLSLLVPSIRFGDSFLLSGHYPLRVLVELPNRMINIQVAPVRYDKLMEDRYLIGARIMEMSDADRQHLMDYIQQVKKSGAQTLNFARDAKSI